MVKTKLVVILALSFVVLATRAAEIQVSVFPASPSASESFRIVFSASEKVDADPNFEPLANVFEVLGQNKNTQVQLSNGRHSSTTRWELEVIAKQTGDLVIPAIQFGSDSSAATGITVANAPNKSADDGDDLLLEIEVDESAPYVQQQVILTVRLLRRISIAGANMTEPNASGDVIIKPLSKDRTYQGDRNGKRYEVFERRFALFPQSSGILDIAPMTVTTQVPRGSRSLFDPFRASTTTRRVRSNSISLQVKTVPGSFTGKVWLPARKLNLREEWEPNSSIKNGEPATRTLYLWSEGLTAGQLPDFPMLEIDSTNIYPDQVQSKEQENDTGFTAVKQQKFAVIANAKNTGTDSSIAIPEIAIPWWNLDTDEMEIASLPARSLPIQFDKNSEAAPPNENAVGAVIEPEPVNKATAPTDEASPPSTTNWRLIALIAIAGWMLTLGAWILVNQRKLAAQEPLKPHQKENLKASQLAKAVRHAAKSNDPFAARNALLAWGSENYRTEEMLSLGQLGRLVDQNLAVEITHLNAYFYASETINWRGENLLNAFQNNTISNHNSSSEASKSALEPLFRLN
ncbi:MAG: BatD family protein [Pseudomonadota bacterium]